MDTSFVKLNFEWNADPNVPEPSVRVEGWDVLVKFYVNPYLFSEFSEQEIGILRFANCQKFRLGSPNDHGWYLGQCRFSKLAPEWGEFYAVAGNPELLDAPADWQNLQSDSHSGNHFLFYFRDETFECVAERCSIEPVADNALYRKGKVLPNF